MPLKRTKSELRVQRESLKRFQRYLPTLQLKKQQLQSELRQVEIAREALEEDLKRCNVNGSPGWPSSQNPCRWPTG